MLAGFHEKDKNKQVFEWYSLRGYPLKKNFFPIYSFYTCFQSMKRLPISNDLEHTKNFVDLLTWQPVAKWKSKLFKAHTSFISVSSEKIMQFGPAVTEIFWPGTPKMTFWEKCIKYHIFYSKTNFLSLRMHLLHKTYTYTLQHVHYSTAWNDYFKFSSRGGSRTAATSKVKHLMIIVNRLKPLTIIAKTFILVLAAVLDPPLSWAYV